MLLGIVIQHARRAIHDHEAIGTIGHLVVCLASGNEGSLQQIQPATLAFHLELKLTLQRQHPLRIVMAVQAGGLSIVPKVEDRAHVTSVRAPTSACNAGAEGPCYGAAGSDRRDGRMNTTIRTLPLVLAGLLPMAAAGQSPTERVAPAPHCLDARDVQQVEQETATAIAVRNGQGQAYRIDFSAACPGINDAGTLRLEAPSGWACGRPSEQVVVDGRRCAVAGVTPIDNREFASTARASGRQYAATLPSVTVTAKGEARQPRSRTRQTFQASPAFCFASRHVRSWSEDAQGVVVETNPRRSGGHRFYRVELAGSCPILAGATSVYFQSGFQNGLICGNPGDRMVETPSDIPGDLRSFTPRFMRPACPVLAVYPKDVPDQASR